MGIYFGNIVTRKRKKGSVEGIEEKKRDRSEGKERKRKEEKLRGKKRQGLLYGVQNELSEGRKATRKRGRDWAGPSKRCSASLYSLQGENAFYSFKWMEKSKGEENVIAHGHTTTFT